MNQPVDRFPAYACSDAEEIDARLARKEELEAWAASNVHFLVAALGVTVGLIGIAWQRMAVPTTSQKIKRRLKVIEKQHYDLPKAA